MRSIGKLNPFFINQYVLLYFIVSEKGNLGLLFENINYTMNEFNLNTFIF